MRCRSLQAAKTAAEATETAAKEAEKCADEGDALEATAKAAIAAWRASQVGITSLAWIAPFYHANLRITLFTSATVSLV